MNVLRGLYFPGTGLKKELFCSLLCLLDKVDFYQIVAEEEAAGSNDGSAYWESLVDWAENKNEMWGSPLP